MCKCLSCPRNCGAECLCLFCIDRKDCPDKFHCDKDKTKSLNTIREVRK